MSTNRTATRTTFNPVEPRERDDAGRTRVDVTGLWTGSLDGYVDGRVAADAEVAVERRGEQVYLVVE
jgi:hypothetical protein